MRMMAEANGPPPSKRAKLNESVTEEAKLKEVIYSRDGVRNGAEIDDDEWEEEEVMRDLEELRPSDLYLDTVSYSSKTGNKIFLMVY
jgi:hypothetical protein